jgi:ATP-dependent 26S proteasome regulatory subunit
MAKVKPSQIKFIDYINASYPLLWIQTHEENRALSEMALAIEDYNNTNRTDKAKRKMYLYDIISGLRPIFYKDGELTYGATITPDVVENEKPIKGSDPLMPIKWFYPLTDAELATPDFVEKVRSSSVIFLKDFSTYIGDKYPDRATVKRMIKNSLDNYRAHEKCLVFINSDLSIPADMEKEITVVDFKLPNREQLKVVLQDIYDSSIPESNNKAVSYSYPTETEDEIIDAACGMTSIEAANAFAVSLVTSKKFDPVIIRKEKARIIKKTNLLEIVESPATLDDIGGLDRLKKWLMDRRESFTEEARKFGVEPPKGMLSIGVPGTGKSLTAKAIANVWGRPLLRLDMGRIFGKYVGESENNLHSVLNLIEGVAPVVLWLDEIEKSLAGNSGSGDESHETTRRVFQILLTWMQEHTADIFLAMTANSIQSLPPEFLRAGRIDAMFWVDLPEPEQVWEILGIHLRKKGFKLSNFEKDRTDLLKELQGFSGAEIEVCVKEALTRAFGARKPPRLTSEDLIACAKTITPISELQKDKITESRRLAMQQHIQLASTPVERKTEQSVNGKKRTIAI